MAIRIAAVAGVLLVVVGATFAATAWAARRWEAQVHAWKTFSAVQDFYPGAPGFVWDARVRMMPGVSAYVRDAFADGEGSMLASAMGLRTIVDESCTPALAEASLMRYLAEAPWFPTALLPSQGVRWDALNGPAARASLSAGAVSARVDFYFGPDGLIERSGALRDYDKLHAKLPWGGVYRRWIERGGMTIPGEAEVAWSLPTGRFAYWRGTVEPVYDLAPATTGHAKAPVRE